MFGFHPGIILCVADFPMAKSHIIRKLAHSGRGGTRAPVKTCPELEIYPTFIALFAQVYQVGQVSEKSSETPRRWPRREGVTACVDGSADLLVLGGQDVVQALLEEGRGGGVRRRARGL